MSGLSAVQCEAMTVRLATALDEAVQLLRDAAYSSTTPTHDSDQSTLLEHCLSLCDRQEKEPVGPVRIVHHMACTGGTLLCKCLGTMPNVQLLSEVDPLSPLLFDASFPRFAPTDINRLVRQSTRGADAALLVDLFHAELRVLHERCERVGQYLVVRDHSHSHYCTGPELAVRPSMRNCIPAEIPVLSVVTVRHPADSFASLVQNKWLSFEPATFSEYCRRYLAFLGDNAGVPVIRYEDFVARPSHVLEALCKALDVPYLSHFEDLISAVHLTGDSGRSSSSIGSRPRRGLAADLVEDSRGLLSYRALTRQLEYDD